MTRKDQIERALRQAYATHRLDEVGDLTLSVPTTHGAKGRPLWQAPIAVAAAVAAITVAVVVTVSTGGHSHHSLPSNSVTGSSVRRPPPGTSAQPQAVLRALVTADGKTIYVQAFGGGCTETAILTASETSSAVTLQLNGYDSTGSDACPSNLIAWTESTTLSQPLGGRALVDSQSGAHVPYIDGSTLATVGWLPTGASKPVNSPYFGWTRTFSFPGQPTAAPLTVSQGPIDLVKRGQFGPSAGQLSHPYVHGHRAILVVDRGSGGGLEQDRIGWVVNGTMYDVESSPSLSSQDPLTPKVIERIARSLQIPQP